MISSPFDAFVGTLKPVAPYADSQGGDLNPRKRNRRAAGSYLVAGLVYGLVNVRTDGHRIQAATLNEADASWSVKNFESSSDRP